MTLRLLHLADLHLGASMSAFGEVAQERRGQLLDAFRELPERARRHEAHAVLVAGDLFDGGEPERAVRVAAADTFRRLADDRRPVLVVPGNHDSPTLHPSPWTEPLGGASVFLEPSFEHRAVPTPAGPLNVYGLAYDASRQPDPLGTFRRADLPGPHVVLLHGSADFSPHWRIGGNALRLPLAALAGLDCDYLALGDYHRHRPPERFGRERPIPACYPGSFAGLDLTESGRRGYVVVELEGGGAPRVELHPSAVPPLADLGDLPIDGAADHGEVAARIAERLEPGELPIVRLTGVPDFPLDRETVELELRERFGFGHAEDASTYYASRRLDEIADDDTVAGHVVRLARERLEAAGDEEERAVAERALRLALQAMGVS